MSLKMLYVNCELSTTHSKAVGLEKHMCKYLKSYFEIISIHSLLPLDEIININNYDLILINGLCFSYNSCRITHDIVYKKLYKLVQCKNVIILMHDLHDFSIKPMPGDIDKYCKGYNHNYPILCDTIYKQYIKNIFKIYGVKSLISLYECTEYDFFVNYFDNIQNFYKINHGYPDDIFYPCNKNNNHNNKIYDILFYGCQAELIYPLRNRIKTILKKRFRIKVINENQYIRESALAKMINESWLCIACVSNFSYFVRKYLEISACNSIVLGDINNQGYEILGTDMLYVNSNMSNSEIINKVGYYLANKDIITAISYNKLEKIQNQSYKTFADKINEICINTITGEKSIYEYTKSKKIDINPNMKHYKKLINIDYTIISNKVTSNIKLNPNTYVFVINIVDKVNDNNYQVNNNDCDSNNNNDCEIDNNNCDFKMVNNNNFINNFKIVDDNNNLLSNNNCYLSDVKNPDIYYVPFKIIDPTFIHFNLIDISKILLYEIKYE